MVGSQTRQIIHKTLIFKQTRARWTEAVAEVVEHLLCKHEALTSNTSPTKIKIKVNIHKAFR
jgi:hypothetical protein